MEVHEMDVYFWFSGLDCVETEHELSAIGPIFVTGSRPSSNLPRQTWLYLPMGEWF